MGNSAGSKGPSQKVEKKPSNSMSLGFPCALDLPEINSTSPIVEKEQYCTCLMMEKHYKNQLQNSENKTPLQFEHNSAFNYEYATLKIPKDEQGFVQSFEPHQEKEYLEFFQTYGLVVVSNLLTEEECKISQDEVWDFLERHNEKLKRNDPTSWQRNWPGLSQLGILGNTPILSPQICNNRQNPKIHRVFQILHGTEKLWVSIDRISLMRPTKNILSNDSTDQTEKKEENQSRDKPEWKTIENWLHWDMNPVTGRTSTYGFEDADSETNRGYDLRVQGILAFVDCGESEGGFHAVPGFQKHIRGYANLHQSEFGPLNRDTTFQVPEENPMRKDIQTMPIRKGSILIWDSKLPHGTFPNDSEKYRMIQYLKMFPTSFKAIKPWIKREFLPPNDQFQLSELGNKLFGYEEWKD